MGNIYSTHNRTEIEDCLICWEQVEPVDVVTCNHCKIRMHTNCEEEYRNTKGYCKCPHCSHVGLIGTVFI